jgi:hypothetical protein
MWIGLLWFQLSLGLGFPFFGRTCWFPSHHSQWAFKRLCHLTCNIIIFMLFFWNDFHCLRVHFCKAWWTFHHNIFVFLCCKGSSSFHFGNCQKLCLSKWLFVSFILSLFKKNKSCFLIEWWSSNVFCMVSLSYRTSSLTFFSSSYTNFHIVVTLIPSPNVGRSTLLDRTQIQMKTRTHLSMFILFVIPMAIVGMFYIRHVHFLSFLYLHINHIWFFVLLRRLFSFICKWCEFKISIYLLLLG